MIGYSTLCNSISFKRSGLFKGTIELHKTLSLTSVCIGRTVHNSRFPETSLSPFNVLIITDNFLHYRENITLKNHSVFHLFFGSKNTVRLKQDVLYYWYDLLSK